MKKTLLFLLSLILCWITSFAAERGIKRVEIKTTSGETVGLYEESHALVIGVSDYTAGWPKLPGVKDDIVSVSKVLEEQGFGVEVVENPKNRIELEQAFNSFIQTHGRKPNNRLLFYFAGHGHTIKNYGEEMGYIVPASSPNPNRDLDRFLDSAMDMQMIEVYAKRIRSKHALFVFDSCFSGSLFALSRAIPQNISYKTASPVRQFITSGTAGETVSDQSIFRRQFISALQGEGDTDKDGYVTALELGEFLQKTVVNYSKNAQHPQYGKIRNPNLDKGDFVFVLPKAALDLGSTSKTAVSVPAIAAPPETSGLQLETLIQQAESQEQAKEKLKQVKTQWAAWQSRMQSDFDAAQTFERREISPDLKIEPWRQFLEYYASNNPFGKKDETLRRKAQGRLKYWRSETKNFTDKNTTFSSGTAIVDLSNTTEVSAPPANPDAEKIWNKYQLGLKRKLPKLAEKYLQKLLSAYPESRYAIQFRVEELQAALDKNGLTIVLIYKIEKIRAKHPRNPELRKLIVLAAPQLLRYAERDIEAGTLESAEDKLNLAANWNVSGSELSRRRKQIQQVRISTLIKNAYTYIRQGNAQTAEQKLNAALRLGADPAKIEKIRRVLPLTLAKVMIQSGKIEEAGELLLEFELEGKYANELPELYTALRNEQNKRKWNGIVTLIKQNQFSKAELEIEGWKNENAPANLPKLKEYLQQEKTEFTQHINKRRVRVRSLIDNKKFKEAKSALAQWGKTDEDRSELLKLTAYYNKKQPSEVIIDRTTGLMWENRASRKSFAHWEAEYYCESLTLNAHSDWHIPSITQLENIWDKKSLFSKINIEGYFHDKRNTYWSGGGLQSASTYNWVLLFGSGVTHRRHYLDEYNVICVRRY